jgi:plasmid stability protein
MKTTFDLPADLVRQLKLRALREGRKLKDAAADVLRAGLAAGRAPAAAEKPATVRRDRKTGLPVIQCRRAAPRDREPTPERVAQILQQQEAQWARDSG